MKKIFIISAFFFSFLICGQRRILTDDGRDSVLVKDVKPSETLPTFVHRGDANTGANPLSIDQLNLIAGKVEGRKIIEGNEEISNAVSIKDTTLTSSEMIKE